MKTVINGKVYDTDTMTTLVSNSTYHNGNYSGQSSICKTPGGCYCYVTESNGQDLYRRNSIEAVAKDQITEYIDGWRLDDEELNALLEEGIVKPA